jgi:hypothetical protein
MSSIEYKYSEVKLQSWAHLHARYWIARTQDEEVAETPVQRQLDSIVAESIAELEGERVQRLERGDVREGLDYDLTWVKEMGALLLPTRGSINSPCS